MLSFTEMLKKYCLQVKDGETSTEQRDPLTISENVDRYVIFK